MHLDFSFHFDPFLDRVSSSEWVSGGFSLYSSSCAMARLREKKAGPCSGNNWMYLVLGEVEGISLFAFKTFLFCVLSDLSWGLR